MTRTRSSAVATAAGPVVGLTYRQLVWRTFRKNRLAMFGLGMVAFLFIVATFAPLLASGKPLAWNNGSGLSSPALREVLAPSPNTPERGLEYAFNFLLVLTVGAALLVLPVSLAVRWRRGGAAARRVFWYGAAGLAVAALVPFLILKPRLDTTDYPRVAAGLERAKGQWAVFAPLRFGPVEQSARPYQPPDRVHLMGTDKVGRDVMSRIIHGARVSLSVGFVAVGIYVAIGVVVGSIAGYFGGRADIVISRLIEIMICFPTFFLILTIMAVLEKRSILNIMLVIGLTGWTGVARLIRGEVLRQKQLDYVTAAQASGSSGLRITFRHILPNAIAPVLVSATFGVAGAILTEAGLSFLGFGVQQPTPSWGELVNQALEWPVGYLWLTTWPGFMIFLSVTVYNLVGEGLRDALDPRLRV